MELFGGYGKDRDYTGDRGACLRALPALSKVVRQGLLAWVLFGLLQGRVGGTEGVSQGLWLSDWKESLLEV